MAEARPWVDQLLPAAASLDPAARAELEWAATVLATEMGDDTAALAARQRLAPLLAKIQDPFLHGICQLAIGWTSPITGDLEGALREVSAGLEQLRGQDEPFFTAMAAYTAALGETALGRLDGALQHLHVMRELADRFGYAWLTASSRVQLGTLAIVQGRLDQARELLDEALEVSLAIRIIRNVTLCLTAFAQLAFAEGDPDQAAMLAGAAEGLRSRAGLRTWPVLRRGEADLVTQARQALGADRFGQAFTAGAAETALGRPDGAQQHLRVMRELADRFGYTWLTASARLQLGILAIVQGRPGQARELLDEALDLSLATRIIRNVTLCLAAFAQLASAEGDPERAALLAGAAEGLRRRAGFSTWPMLRRGEAQLAAQTCQALGDDRFGQAFAAGARLSQQEAVAIIRDQPSDHTQPS